MSRAADYKIEPLTSRRDALGLTGAERWYVLRSLPRQELKAEFFLLRQGFRVFLPRMSKTVRHARKLRAVQSPVFPGYMFVILDPARDRWRTINGTFGVTSLVMALETPQPVPRGVVERLLDHTGDDGLMRFDLDLREEQPVRIISGPFASAIGCLERLDPSGRVRVLLDIMGGKVPAFLDRSALEAA